MENCDKLINDLKKANKACDMMKNCKECTEIIKKCNKEVPCTLIRNKYGISIWDSKEQCRELTAIEDEAIKKAEELLTKNGYIIKKITASMKKDCKRCEQMQEQGIDMDCMDCACSICIMQ